METQLWYWALIVEITVKKSSPESKGEIWENLVILTAASAEEAFTKAEHIGKSTEGDCGGSLTLDGEPAETHFLGVSDMGVIHDGLHDGAEILFRSRRGYTRTALSKHRPKEDVLRDLAEEVRFRQGITNLQIANCEPSE